MCSHSGGLVCACFQAVRLFKGVLAVWTPLNRPQNDRLYGEGVPGQRIKITVNT